MRSQLLKSLVARQAPKALFIVCPGSRVALGLLIQREPGELFVIRNAGNIVPGCGPQPGGVSASMGHAVVMLGVGDIVVCGHSDCGAMGAIASCICLDQLLVVAGRLHNAETARAMNSAHEHASEVVRLDVLVRYNVIAQLANLCTHPCIACALEQSRLNLHGWVYDIENGRTDVLDGASWCFVPLAEHPEVRAVGGALGQTAT